MQKQNLSTSGSLRIDAPDMPTLFGSIASPPSRAASPRTRDARRRDTRMSDAAMPNATLSDATLCGTTLSGTTTPNMAIRHISTLAKEAILQVPHVERYLERHYGAIDSRERVQIAQETLSAFYDAVVNGNYVHEGSPVRYMVAIARNHAIDYRNRRGREERITSQLPDNRERIDVSFENESTAREIVGRITPLRYKQAFVMYYWNGQRVEEIAEIQGVTCSAARHYIERARLQAREIALQLGLLTKKQFDELTKKHRMQPKGDAKNVGQKGETKTGVKGEEKSRVKKF